MAYGVFATHNTDVMPYSLGVSVQDPVSMDESCAVILEKNQPLPCSATEHYGSVTDDQLSVAKTS